MANLSKDAIRCSFSHRRLPLLKKLLEDLERLFVGSVKVLA